MNRSAVFMLVNPQLCRVCFPLDPSKAELVSGSLHYSHPCCSSPPSTADGRYLLFGSNEDATKSQFLRFFSQADWDAHKALQV